MGKKKLARWAELETLNNVIQAEKGRPGKDHPLKGNWKGEVFCNGNRIVLELGCGKGEYTVGLSSAFPDSNFIGIDIKGARIWKGAKTAHLNKISNVAFLRTRIEFIASYFSGDEVDEIWITFPDPHPGKRNSNKRLTCPWFLNVYRNFLIDDGIIHLKTDNTELYDYTRSLARENDLVVLQDTADLYSERLSIGTLSIRTYYENIFLEKGHKIKYLSFKLKKNKVITDAVTTLRNS